jgi:hypothetical protein
MTFDEWFAAKGYDECHRNLMRLGWTGAVQYSDPEVKTVVVNNVDVAALLQLVPRRFDTWVVRVRGGKIESKVQITCIADEDVFITDVPEVNRRSENRPARSRPHKVANLEFLRLISRGDHVVNNSF